MRHTSENLLLLTMIVTTSIVSCNSIDADHIHLGDSNSPIIETLGNHSFQENGVDARFIPILDNADDVSLGARYDTLTGKIVGTSPCIAGFTEVERGNQDTHMRLVEVNDSYSQMKALDIDVSLQGSYLGASGNAKASYVQSQNYSQTSQNFVLYARSTKKPRTLDAQSGALFDLNGDAKTAIEQGPDVFRTLCGDAFVVAIYEGIELYGMLTFNGVNQNNKQSNSAEMKGSYGNWSVSASAKKLVESDSANSNLQIEIGLYGRCDVMGSLGGDTTAKWATITDTATKLPSCVDGGANMLSFKVVPYSDALIRGWPYGDQAGPDLNRLMYYYSSYRAILDSTDALLKDRASSYKLALFGRGTGLKDMESLAATIRDHNKNLLALLNDCQSQAVAANRPSNCQQNNQLQNALDNFPHPYVYRAQLPLFFTDSNVDGAFLSDSQLKTRIFQENVTIVNDQACEFAKNSSNYDYPGCLEPSSEELSKALTAITVTPVPSKRFVVFKSQSTSTNLCMAAPYIDKNKKKVVAKASTCNLSDPAKSRQRLQWLSSGQLQINNKPSCVQGRFLEKCDSVKQGQLWRFVPSTNDPNVGRIQSAEGQCLGHSNVDKNVTYVDCEGKLAKEAFYLWEVITVK